MSQLHDGKFCVNWTGLHSVQTFGQKLFKVGLSGCVWMRLTFELSHTEQSSVSSLMLLLLLLLGMCGQGVGGFSFN